MGDTFVTRTGRTMPIPTRAAYFTPAKRMARQATNDRRLRAARNYFSAVPLRLVPQVRMCPEQPHQYGALQGRAIMITVDEAIDVWELLSDTLRFWRSWRPMRRRTDMSKTSVQAAWDRWERSALDLKP
jgi:hypothetical protein